MADEIKQTDRLMSLQTPAGADVLCMENANITECLSKPFVMQFDVLAEKSKKPSIKYDQLLGNNVTLTLKLPGEKKRYFCGIVSRFSEGDEDERFAYYRMEVVPWLWLLTLTTDCKVFQDKSVPDIIEDVFKEWQGKYSQVVHFENKTSGSFTKLDYCVQYRETDFDFVSRLMEQEGIFYYFKHEDGKHTLVMNNDPSSLEACPNLEKARYMPESGMGEWEDGILTLDNLRSIVPGKVTLGDYHFQMSNKTLRESSSGSVKVASNDNLEIFDYPGEYAQRFNKPDQRLGDVEKNGGDLAKWRMEEQSSQHQQITGTSSCRAFTTGYYFSLLGKNAAEKKLPGTAGKYVLTSVKHSIQQNPDYVSGDTVAQPYRNTFTCVPQEAKYRPERSTPRPIVQGMQTALVVGLNGEEIDCDKYGRVKVQFHWDREGKKDEKSSCWVRVASLLAGKEWGMVHIPRIGQEVVVAFLEGDPDQPLIVGSVYNYDNMPPYKLPDNKTQSGLKTRSTKQGSPDNFNELRFEDKKGSEEVYFHAEKDFNRVVENNDMLKVGFQKKDSGDQFIEIHNNQDLTIGEPTEDGSDPQDGSQLAAIWNNQEVTIGKGAAKATDGSQIMSIWNNQELTIGKGKGQNSDGSQIIEIFKDRTVTLDTGNDSVAIKLGNQTTKLDVGQSSTEAMQSITLKVGQSSIKIDQTGVSIDGMMIKINGQIQTQISGVMTQLSGSAMTQISGGITMIG